MLGNPLNLEVSFCTFMGFRVVIYFLSIKILKAKNPVRLMGRRGLLYLNLNQSRITCSVNKNDKALIMLQTSRFILVSYLRL